MPTYQYRCQTCGTEYETHQSIKDEPLTDCIEECKGEAKRVYFSVGVAFKADGFYSTDTGGGSLAATEKQLEKDMGAYKRLRGDGLQPPMVQGCSELEKKAVNKFEVESGQVVKNDKSRKELAKHLEGAK